MFGEKRTHCQGEKWSHLEMPVCTSMLILTTLDLKSEIKPLVEIDTMVEKKQERFV